MRSGEIKILKNRERLLESTFLINICFVDQRAAIDSGKGALEQA
jgi:hypothetical protein